VQYLKLQAPLGTTLQGNQPPCISLRRFGAEQIFYPDFYLNHAVRGFEAPYLLVTFMRRDGQRAPVIILPSWSCDFDYRRPL